MESEGFRLQGVAFVDHGEATINNPLPSEVVSRDLTGAGAGVRVAVNDTVSMRLDVGWPISGKSAGSDSVVTYGQIVSRF
jgi:hemolysin activation/secretion protein